MGFANAVLQLGLWLTGPRILERYGRLVSSESEFYQWGAILMLNPVLWGVGTALWVLLLRIFRRAQLRMPAVSGRYPRSQFSMVSRSRGYGR